MASSSRKARPPQSLKMQAIGFLSRREYSRQELRVKLLAAWRKRAALAAAAASLASASGLEAAAEDSSGAADPSPEPPSEAPSGPSRESPSEAEQEAEHEAEHEVDTLLDWLQSHGYLSDERFVESRVHARAARHGSVRIRQELARHGLALEPEQAAALRETEFDRAKAVWQRKFGEPAPDARGRAAQARFLAGRGFTADVVRRIVGGVDES